MPTLSKLISNNDRKNRTRSQLWQRTDLGLAEVLRPKACSDPICAITLKTHRDDSGTLTDVVATHGRAMQMFDSEASPEDVRAWYESQHPAPKKRKRKGV